MISMAYNFIIFLLLFIILLDIMIFKGFTYGYTAQLEFTM